MGLDSLEVVAKRHKIPVSTLSDHVTFLKNNNIRTADDLKGLQRRKAGRPCFLPPDVEKMAADIINAFRAAGTVVSASTVVATANALMGQLHKERLKENGGAITFSSLWARQWLRRHNWVKRKATTGKRHAPSNLEAERATFTKAIDDRCRQHSIPPQLVYNIDETAVKIVPAAGWTMEQKGASTVAVTGIDDKRQVTATIAVTAAGEKLPIHLIYEGSTVRCEPPQQYRPQGWLFSHSTNHWSNRDLFVTFLKEVVVPHRDAYVKEMKLPQVCFPFF
jgi:hypothetical protein